MKFPECETCLWWEVNRDMCDTCEEASEYEPIEDDEYDEYKEGVAELKTITFFMPRHQEAVSDPDEGIPDYLLKKDFSYE